MGLFSLGETMALTNKQRAAQDLAEKLRLEEELSLSVTRLFERVADEFQRSMIEDGVPPNFDGWQGFFEDILLSHYQATGDVFSKRIQDQLNLELSKDEKEIIAAALLLYFTNQSRSSAEQINDTNRNQAQEAVQAARAQEQVDFQETGSYYDSLTFAAVATNAFRSKIFGRVITIGVTETQNAAEASKFTEAEVFEGKRPTVNDPARPAVAEELGYKTWTAILDDATRPTHVDADEQKVKYNAFFIVGGYKMRFPGDKAQGAPIEEWINCRCCSIYTPSPGAFDRHRRN